MAKCCHLLLSKIHLPLYEKLKSQAKQSKRLKMKQCTKCKKWKDESEFNKKRKSKDGLRYWCKECLRECARKYYHRKQKHSKKYYRYEKRHRIVDGVKEKRCSRCKKWKAESEFYKRSTHKDGLTVWCKKCANEATNKCRKQRLAV